MNRILFVFSILLLPLSGMAQEKSFKDDQLRYPRVRQAYEDKEVSMLGLLKDADLEKDNAELYLRAFKKEKEIELWGRDISGKQFTLIKTYEVCRTSGSLGPKRRQGDLQIPEGYYHINVFNPYSNFYLSMGINYPNKSDRILGVQGNLGGDIYIHGACVTIGCMPITDEEIKELYIFCVEAKDKGQQKIPVTIFPCRLEDEAYRSLCKSFEDDDEKIGLWADLKSGYDIFNETKELPLIGFLRSGRHEVKR